MKGVVFTEFLDMVEGIFGYEVADRIIAGAALGSGGAYTAVGTYDHSELLALATGLADVTGQPVNELVRTYGKHLFKVFVSAYPQFFAQVTESFDFLSQIEDYIHVEVRKLYPDAELPSFESTFPDAGTMVLTYESPRPFADFAHGLIEGCIAHFGEDIEVAREDIAGGARFLLTQVPAQCRTS